MRLLTQNAPATHLELTGIFNTLYGILACGETQLEVATSHFLSGVLLSSSSQRKVPVRQVASIIFTRPIMASSCVVATELSVGNNQLTQLGGGLELSWLRVE